LDNVPLLGKVRQAGQGRDGKEGISGIEDARRIDRHGNLNR
jgi:hypothetical protein